MYFCWTMKLNTHKTPSTLTTEYGAQSLDLNACPNEKDFKRRNYFMLSTRRKPPILCQ